MYSLTFSKEARKFIDKQSPQTKQRIRNALLQLAEDPFSSRQVKRLQLRLLPQQGQAPDGI